MYNVNKRRTAPSCTVKTSAQNFSKLSKPHRVWGCAVAGTHCKRPPPPRVVMAYVMAWALSQWLLLWFAPSAAASALRLTGDDARIQFGQASFYGTCGQNGSFKFVSPQNFVSIRGLEPTDMIHVRLTGVADDCEDVQITQPCVATSDPQHPALFYVEFSATSARDPVIVGPLKARASIRQGALGHNVSYAFLSVPFLPHESIDNLTGSARAGTSNQIRLAIKHYAPLSASSSYAVDALSLPFAGVYGGDEITVVISGPPSAPPTMPPSSPLPPCFRFPAGESLDVTEGSTKTLNTGGAEGGTFYFSGVTIGGTLLGSGPNPLQIWSTGPIVIGSNGLVDVSGGNGAECACAERLKPLLMHTARDPCKVNEALLIACRVHSPNPGSGCWRWSWRRCCRSGRTKHPGRRRHSCRWWAGRPTDQKCRKRQRSWRCWCRRRRQWWTGSTSGWLWFPRWRAGWRHRWSTSRRMAMSRWRRWVCDDREPWSKPAVQPERCRWRLVWRRPVVNGLAGWERRRWWWQ